MRRIAFAAVAAFTLLASAAAHAEDIDWKEGKLGHLSRYIGTDKVEKVMGDPAVLMAIGKVMPPNLVKSVNDRLEVRGPIDFIDGNLVLNGNMAHRGDTDTVSVWISIYDAKVRVVLMAGGKTTLYAKDGKYDYLPWVLRAGIVNRDWRTLANPPSFLTWMK